MKDEEVLVGCANVNKYFFVRVLKNLLVLLVLWIPIFYLVYSRLNYTIAIIFNGVLVIYLCVYLLYRHKYAIDKITIINDKVKIQLFKYSNLIEEEFSIFSTELVYIESGIILLQGKLSIMYKDKKQFFQYSGLEWNRKKLKKSSEVYKLVRDQIRYEEANININKSTDI